MKKTIQIDYQQNKNTGGLVVEHSLNIWKVPGTNTDLTTKYFKLVVETPLPINA